MVIHMTRTNDLVDGAFRPIASNLTVAEVAAYLLTNPAPAFIEARWNLYPDAPVSLDRQQVVKLRRLGVIAKSCGRAVVRVERVRIDGYLQRDTYRALLAK